MNNLFSRIGQMGQIKGMGDRTRLAVKNTTISYMDFFQSSGKSFNVLSRIIIVIVNFIIFEKFLEDKIIKIKLQTLGKNIKTKFLDIIYKEFWYLPFVILFYNIIVIIFIYILYFCFYILVIQQNKDKDEDTNMIDIKNNYLFDTKILTEMLILTCLSFIVNLIILIVVYYILVIMSKENVTKINDKNNNIISDGFIEKFYSYYRFSYYSSILFISIFLQTIEYKNWKNLRQ